MVKNFKMKLRYLIIGLLVITFFIIGCENIKTSTGQVIKETVKDTDKESTPSEKIVETKTEEKPSCNDECSTNSCDGYKFISCETINNGCKSEVNKGHVKGKCNVGCITDSDCKGNEQCSVNFNCIEKEIVCSDECNSDYCDKFNHISCLIGKDGCKYNQNKGLIKG